MSCENCGSCGTENGTPKGCGDKGHCSSGGCNRLNTFDWLSDLELPDNQSFDIVEIGFKNNARKEFFKKPTHLHLVLGDNVLVESTGGFDIGSVSLSGELVRLQMQKKRIRENANFPAVLRHANERDMERLREVRSLEKDVLIQARAVARQLDLDMKIGDIEFQGDGRKLTFFYTSEGRVDFRELIRIYAKEFKVKIEMRQIGARQESARLGGIGTCGRELCCSTWLADFKSVSTVAARYQNLAINQSKLSGQCGRLKCCLNYELKTYLDALRDIPRNVERLDTERGLAVMVKMDIFKKIMYFGYKQQFGVTDIQPLPVDQVRLIHQLNKEGLKPVALNQLTNDEVPVDFTQMLNGNDQERRSRHREQGQNLHKQIADNEQNQDDEAIVLPAMSERKKKKPSKPKQANTENRTTNNEQSNTEQRTTNSENRTTNSENRTTNSENRTTNSENRKPNTQRPKNPNLRQNPPKNQDKTQNTSTENNNDVVENQEVKNQNPPKNQQNRQNPRQNQPKKVENSENQNTTEQLNSENRTTKTEQPNSENRKPNTERPKHPNQQNRQNPPKNQQNRQNQPKKVENSENQNTTEQPNNENRTTKTEQPNNENRTTKTEQPNNENRTTKTEQPNNENRTTNTEKPKNQQPRRNNPNQNRRPPRNEQQSNKTDSNNPPPPPANE